MRQFFYTLLLLCIPISGWAQAVLTPRNMALGGGGSTYITDANANFYNPANLMIQDREGNFSITFGAGGFYLDALQNYSVVEDQIDHLRHYVDLYDGSAPAITNTQRISMINDQYPGNNTLSDNRARYDITLLGLKWKSKERAYSIALRSRTSSSFRSGRGWYENTFIDTENGNQLHNRSLIHRYQSLYEISFGYSESFRFLTGLTPRLDNFTIGIAPKFVMGGDYLNAEWKNYYYQDRQTEAVTNVQSLNYDASGDFSASTNSYLREHASPFGSFSNDMTDIHGMGAGLDIGVTYLLTLGDDLTAVRSGDNLTRRSLRLSFSMTDIGFISYSTDDMTIDAEQDTQSVSSIPEQQAGELFTGARGQYIDFIEKFSPQNPFQTVNPIYQNFSTLLPMALHGGLMLEVNRFKLMGDMSVGLTNNAFNSTKLVTALGVELRPLTFLPLRGGVQFKAENLDFLSLGLAVETRYWDFSVAGQLTPSTFSDQTAIAGVSVAAFQFHF